jgi:uncharacterized SAM-binding protein YcdF (DUF218 family)
MKTDCHDAHQVDTLARLLWDYLTITENVSESDFILALGSHDLRVAEAAADTFNKGLGKWLVTSGGFGKVTKALWNVPEAVRFAQVAETLGVPHDRILIEPTATNTGDNIIRVRDMLSLGDIPHDSAIIVTKPYMTRRALATARKQWPSVHWTTASPPLSYDTYTDEFVTKDRMINLLVGDVQRMKVYGENGFQQPQVIPDAVWNAFEQLSACGYDDFVLR